MQAPNRQASFNWTYPLFQFPHAGVCSDDAPPESLPAEVRRTSNLGQT